MKLIILIFLTIILIGCGFGAGTHGSVKGYQYPVTKYALEKAIMNVLQKNNNVYRDTVKNYMIYVTDGKNDTIFNDYYNDGENYLTIFIKNAEEKNEYVFRYYGDSLEWKNSSTSEIFICYTHDNDGNGGSEGNGGLAWYKHPGLKQKLISNFEAEFISKIDIELNHKHIDAE